MHIVNFAEAPDTVPQNLREVAPHIFLAVPRVWEKLYSAVTIQIKEGTRARPPRLQGGHRASATRRAPTRSRASRCRRRCALARAIADWLVLKNIRVILGLDRIRWAVTGAAPISPDLIALVLGAGREDVRGLRPDRERRPRHLQLSGPPQDRHHRPRRARHRGQALDRRARSCCKGPHIFKGYLNKPEKTAEALRDGWLHTGDVGIIDNQGFVRITDRMKDIIITAGGKNITPSEIENQLKFSPYISDAVVIGDKRSYLTCLIMIDHDNVVKFAQDHNVPFTNYASLCRAPRGAGADRQGGGGGQQEVRPRRDHQEVPPDRRSC